MADVFFSYKREDRSAVERLVRLLEAEGISIWWDPSIVPGERYAAVIRRALNEAVCVVVAWSHQSIDSLWVQDEAGIGRDRGVLVPISLDGIEPPLGFRQLQTANLADWNGRPDDPRILHFLAGVRRLVSASARSAPPAVATAPVGNIARPLVRAGPEAATTVADSNPLATKPSVSWRKIAIVVACTLAAALLTAGALTLGPQR